jgi:hypothetical protein
MIKRSNDQGENLCLGQEQNGLYGEGNERIGVALFRKNGVGRTHEQPLPVGLNNSYGICFSLRRLKKCTISR